ncbi:copper chaperone PCu(A)C [Pseudactinotalea sp.]|uniref:copper chaperone PCu(A)C n=1 Tax=Pseudactinotalea sp. TaxID=1926260 RepID=UPI003B3B7AA4
MTHTWMTPARTAAMAMTAMLALAACGTSTEAEPEVADELVVVDAWVKAEDEGMTAAFGTLENPTGTDVEVVAVASPAATAMELHETVMNDDGLMVMQEVEAFTVPAGGSTELEPGGDHLMFMGLTGPITAGDDVEITLTLADGSEVTFVAVAKDYEGANETYEDGHGSDEHGEMDH